MSVLGISAVDATVGGGAAVFCEAFEALGAAVELLADDAASLPAVLFDKLVWTAWVTLAATPGGAAAMTEALWVGATDTAML